MSIEVICSNCGAKLKAPEAARGKKAKCGKCRQPVLVPRDDVPMAEPASEPEPFPTLSENENPFDFGTPAASIPARAASTPSPPAASPPPTPSPTPPAAAPADPFSFAQDPPLPIPAGRSKTLTRRSSAAQPAATPTTATEANAPRYRTSREQPTANRLLYISIGLGVIALLLGAVGVYVYLDRGRRVAEAQQAAQATKNVASDEKLENNSNNQKDESTPVKDASSKGKDSPKNSSPPRPAEPGSKPGNRGNAETKGKDTSNPKGNPPVPSLPSRSRHEDPGPPPGATLLKLSGTVRIPSFAPPPAQPQAADRVRHRLKLPIPHAAIQYFYPPERPDNDDSFVVYRSGGKDSVTPPRWILEQISPVGTRVSRLEWEADDRPFPRLAIHRGKEQLRCFAATGERVTVWEMPSKSVIRENIDPFAGLAEVQAAGLAALFPTTEPQQFIAVATSGLTVVYDLTLSKVIEQFRPPQPLPGRVRWQHSTAADGDQRTFVLVQGGMFYHFRCDAQLTRIAQVTLGGEVQRSLAVAVEGERLLYVFETGDASQRERAILFSTHKGRDSFRLLRWPRDIGEPLYACWSESTALIATSRGGLLLQHDEGNLVPFAFVQTDSGTNATSPWLTTRGSYLWYLLPDPTDTQGTLACSLVLPPDDYTQFAERFSGNQPLPRLLLTAEGLKK